MSVYMQIFIRIYRYVCTLHTHTQVCPCLVLILVAFHWRPYGAGLANRTTLHLSTLHPHSWNYLQGCSKVPWACKQVATLEPGPQEDLRMAISRCPSCDTQALPAETCKGSFLILDARDSPDSGIQPMLELTWVPALGGHPSCTLPCLETKYKRELRREALNCDSVRSGCALEITGSPPRWEAHASDITHVITCVHL